MTADAVRKEVWGPHLIVVPSSVTCSSSGSKNLVLIPKSSYSLDLSMVINFFWLENGQFMDEILETQHPFVWDFPFLYLISGG